MQTKLKFIDVFADVTEADRMFSGKKVFTVEERKRAAKKMLSIQDRTEGDVIRLAEEYGIKYKTVYFWAKKICLRLRFALCKKQRWTGI